MNGLAVFGTGRNMPDIFDFWNNVGASAKVHPDDERILLKHNGRHAFELKCLPVPFYGPLRTAPIVLLYLNPGFTHTDLLDAEDKKAQQFWFNQRQGYEFLRSQIEKLKKSWWVSRTKCFGVDPEILRTKMAVLEICPYHSISFKDFRLLKELPSCHVSVQWARDVLFPEARDRKKVVICLRAAKHWRLTRGTQDGFLFAPETTRSGHMIYGSVRDNAIAAVREVLSSKLTSEQVP
jgi:hypothetical protein